MIIGDQKYTCTFDFFAPIKLEGSVWNTLPNSVQMKLVKEDAEAEFWPRLTTDKVKEKSFVTIDWDKYVDEDEQDGADIDDSALAGGEYPSPSPFSLLSLSTLFNQILTLLFPFLSLLLPL